MLQRIDNIFNGRKGSSVSFHSIWCELQCVTTIFSEEGRVASLKDFGTASTKRLLKQCLLQKYKSKA